MRHYHANQTEGVVDLDTAVEAMRAAYSELQSGAAQVQARQSLVSDGLRLSTMAALIPSLGYCGAKVYTATPGQFSFIIILFSTETGERLASFDAGPLTALRTAAVSCLAASYLARSESQVLSVFGTGAQARAHAIALAGRYPLYRIDVIGRGENEDFAQSIQETTGVQTTITSSVDALARADIVVTATRAQAPLFHGSQLRPGTTVLAIGSAKPDAAEIDVATLSRSARVVVESADLAWHEAGDLILAKRAGLDMDRKLVELGALITHRADGRKADDEINVFESVGSALEDVAIAAAVYERLKTA